MTARTTCSLLGQPDRPVAWVVPGPLRQVTGGYLYDARIVDGLRARGWPVGVVDVRCTRWPLDFGAGRRLARTLSRQRWGVVVVDELAHPTLAAAALTGSLRRAIGDAPLVLLVHHLRWSEPAPWLLRLLAKLVERVAVRQADLVICTSDTTAQTVARLARTDTPVAVVRPGWDTHQEQPHPTGSPLPHAGEREPPSQCPSPSQGGGVGEEDSSANPEHAVEEGHVRLLLVGHWTPRKGIVVALEAIARALDTVSLDLVGEQDRDQHYAARVWSTLRDPRLSGRVRVHGRVSATDLAALFASADGLLLTSTHEGYGMVLAEALAAGLPVIATRVGAVPDVVRDGFEAELVPPGDDAALSRAIERLAADPRERRRRSVLARERARTLPRWSGSILAFEGHLRDALARTSAGD